MLLDLAASPLFTWDVFTGVLGRELAASTTALSAVFSVGLVAFVAAVVLGGRAADRVPPRRLAVLSAAGAASGLLGSAEATSAAALALTFGLLVGASSGLGYVTAVRVAAAESRGRGLALGLVVSAYALGAAILAPVAAVLLTSLGRSVTFVLLAGVMGLVLVVAAVLVPGVAPTHSAVAGRPARPDSAGRALVALGLVFGLGSAPALAAFAQAGPLAGAAPGVVPAVTLLNVGNVVGRLVAGPLSDRIGRAAALHGNAALLVLACLPLASGVGGATALAALFILGAQYGGLSALVPAACADVVPAGELGTAVGLVFAGWGIAGLLAPVVTAAAATRLGYDGVSLAFVGIAAAAWLGVAAFTAPTRKRPAPRG